jgi:hypothetical protein
LWWTRRICRPCLDVSLRLLSVEQAVTQLLPSGFESWHPLHVPGPWFCISVFSKLIRYDHPGILIIGYTYVVALACGPDRGFFIILSVDIHGCLAVVVEWVKQQWSFVHGGSKQNPVLRVCAWACVCGLVEEAITQLLHPGFESGSPHRNVFPLWVLQVSRRFAGHDRSGCQV